MKQIIDCTTGEVIERDLNKAELAQATIDAKTVADAQAESVAKAAAKAAVLTKLGLTEDELKAALA